jgi:hypothetical protein
MVNGEWEILMGAAWQEGDLFSVCDWMTVRDIGWTTSVASGGGQGAESVMNDTDLYRHGAMPLLFFLKRNVAAARDRDCCRYYRYRCYRARLGGQQYCVSIEKCIFCRKYQPKFLNPNGVPVHWYPALLCQVAVCSVLLIIPHPLYVLLVNQHINVLLDLLDARRKPAFRWRIIQITVSRIGGA